MFQTTNQLYVWVYNGMFMGLSVKAVKIVYDVV